jgi:capsular polysaccharide biosynthesis protein
MRSVVEGARRRLRERREERSERAALQLLGRHLTAAAPRVLVLSPDRRSRYAALVREAHPGATVRQVRPSLPPSELHVRLSVHGPFDAVVDASRKPRVRAKLFRAAFFHLAKGGVYLAVDREPQEAALDQAYPATLGSLLQRVGPPVDGVRPAARSPQEAADLRALADAVAALEHAGGHTAVVSAVDALAKLTEHEANAVLRRRGGEDKVLHTVPAADFASTCTFSSSTGVRPPQMPDRYTTPEMSLREYHEAVCIPGQVAVKGNLVLPDTYRHNMRKRLGNRFTVELGRRFAAVEEDLDSVERLSGTYFYLDDEVRGHFGHAITEQLSRLWAVPLARQVAPDLKAILAINKGRELQPFEVELYGAAGFAPEDLVFRHAPARVERLLGATPMFSMPQYVHPDVVHTWTAVGDALEARSQRQPTARRLFVSRRIRKRACLNTPDVEALFSRHGFEVVYPEDFALPDQVAMFRHAEVVAGFAGSGLFHVCFSTRPQKVIMLGHEGYTATNEYQMASVRGHELVSVVSGIDRTERDDRVGVNRFQSSWSFDFEHEGRFLEQVLGGL